MRKRETGTRLRPLNRNEQKWPFPTFWLLCLPLEPFGLSSVARTCCGGFPSAPVQCAVRKIHVIQRTGWFSTADYRVLGYLGLEGTHKDHQSPASGPAKNGVWNQGLHCKSFPCLGCYGIFILTSCKKVASFFIQCWWCKYKVSEDISSKIWFWLKKHSQVLRHSSICFFLIQETCDESEETCIFCLALLAVFQNHAQYLHTQNRPFLFIHYFSWRLLRVIKDRAMPLWKLGALWGYLKCLFMFLHVTCPGEAGED